MPLEKSVTAGFEPPSHGKFLLLQRRQWLLATFVGLALAVVFFPAYESISLWVGGTLFLVGVIVVHLRYVCHFIVPVPHLFLLIIAVQYVLGAWASVQYPSSDPACNIGSRLPGCLSYGTLVLLTCAIGSSFSMAKLRPAAPGKVTITPRLLTTFDMMILAGCFAVAVGKFSHASSLNFVFTLLGNLRYLGVFGRMVCKGPGWVWRLGLILTLEVVFSSMFGMFGNIILWGVWAFAMWIYLFKASRQKLTIAFIVALVLMPSVHESKWQLRDSLFGDENEAEIYRRAPERALLWLSYFGRSLQKTVTGNLDKAFFGDFIARFNQAWIIDRVMQHVPDYEPYARGDTLRDAFIGAFFPRFIMPDKPISGGRENMAIYAGMELDEGTSMNLGFGGEMYANFGYWGGIIGSGLYALALALLFRWIAVRALASPLWWSVLPYVGFLSLKAEEDVLSVLNWIVKACVFMMGVCVVFPAFRRALFAAPARSQPAHGKTPRNHKGVRAILARRANQVGLAQAGEAQELTNVPPHSARR